MYYNFLAFNSENKAVFSKQRNILTIKAKNPRKLASTLIRTGRDAAKNKHCITPANAEEIHHTNVHHQTEAKNLLPGAPAAAIA